MIQYVLCQHLGIGAIDIMTPNGAKGVIELGRIITHQVLGTEF
jgi:hypothetical protein